MPRFQLRKKLTCLTVFLVTTTSWFFLFSQSLNQPIMTRTLLSVASASRREQVKDLKKIFNLTLTYQPWKDDPACQQYMIRFIMDKSYPPMALVSYPGSGNTWIRQLIEGLTGIFTGSVYEDDDIILKGHYGELTRPDCRCTIVQKTHEYFPQEKTPNKTDFHGNGVLVIRNPYKAIISHKNFRDSHSHVKLVEEDHFKGPEWNEYVFSELRYWRFVALKWIRTLQKGGILHYENLVEDRTNQIRKLMKYLAVQVDDKRLKCVLRHDPMAFKRNSHVTFDPFTDDHRKLIDGAIIEVQQALKEKRFDPLPLHLYDYFNKTVTSPFTVKPSNEIESITRKAKVVKH